MFSISVSQLKYLTSNILFSFFFSAQHSLLIALKTTIEGLLATHSINVWNTYGGLNRVCQCVENILIHRLKSAQVSLVCETYI